MASVTFAVAPVLYQAEKQRINKNKAFLLIKLK